MLFLTLGLLCGSIYDLFGKKILFADVFIAGSCFFIVLFGASTVSISFTSFVYLVSLACFFHILFNNAVEGGLKDIDHDALAGAKTTATRLQVKIVDGKLVVTKRFAAFAYLCKLFYLSLVFLVSLLPEVSFWNSTVSFLAQIFLVFLLAVVVVTLYRFWHPPEFNRKHLIKVFGIHEIAAYALGPIVLLPVIGISLTLLLLVLPVVWFFLVNLCLYGHPLYPQV